MSDDFRLDVEDSYLGVEDTIDDGGDDATNEGAELLVIIDGGGLDEACQDDVQDVEDDEDNLAGFHICLVLDFLEALAGEDAHHITEGTEDGGGDDVEAEQGDDGVDGQVQGEQAEEDSEDEVDESFHGISCF